MTDWLIFFSNIWGVFGCGFLLLNWLLFDNPILSLIDFTANANIFFWNSFLARNLLIKVFSLRIFFGFNNFHNFFILFRLWVGLALIAFFIIRISILKLTLGIRFRFIWRERLLFGYYLIFTDSGLSLWCFLLLLVNIIVLCQWLRLLPSASFDRVFFENRLRKIRFIVRYAKTLSVRFILLLNLTTEPNIFSCLSFNSCLLVNSLVL